MIMDWMNCARKHFNRRSESSGTTSNFSITEVDCPPLFRGGSERNHTSALARLTMSRIVGVALLNQSIGLVDLANTANPANPSPDHGSFDTTDLSAAHPIRESQGDTLSINLQHAVDAPVLAPLQRVDSLDGAHRSTGGYSLYSRGLFGAEWK